MERLRKERHAKYMNRLEKEAKWLKKEEDHQEEAKRLKRENDRKKSEEDRKRIIAEGKEKSSSKSGHQGTPLREIQIQLEDDLKMSTTDSSTDEDQSWKRKQ